MSDSESTANEIEKVEFEEEYLPDLSFPEEPTCCILESPLGTGKTTSVLSYIVEEQPESVIFVMFRRSLARDIGAKLQNLEMGFVNYQNVSGLLRQPKLMVQVESLHRLKRTEFDLVVVDEITSVLTQFASPFHRDHLEANRRQFEELFTNPRIVLMDGFVDDRVLDFVRDGDFRKIWFRNLIEKNDRIYTEISQRNIVPTLKSLLQKNYKIVIPSSTKKMAIQLKAECLKLRKKVLFFCGDTRVSDSHAKIANINAEVLEVDVLIYTPTLQAGVDIWVEHFDVMLALGSPFSCCARDFIQMMWRVRSIRELVIWHVSGGRGKPQEIKESEDLWGHLTDQVIQEQNASALRFRSEFLRLCPQAQEN